VENSTGGKNSPTQHQNRTDVDPATVCRKLQEKDQILQLNTFTH